MYIAYYKKSAFGIGNTEDKALEKAKEILMQLGQREMERAFLNLKTAPLSKTAYAALEGKEIVLFSLIQGIFELN
ncbi:hypothetical protein SAMN05444141_11416 [Pseudovibrio denitrificans]|uniref:Uncharacterized protein n=1 Tax=Pseudovibrio denitrificans TaxID=258256 RepID=A0A1I7DZG3_9HYPH|nr:hypothetical protein [Pseudovibrio denitrificans]SFU17026.1 hypothetical protein SAMN05444141_11416 [Pseudovibrio denitrificans]